MDRLTVCPDDLRFTQDSIKAAFKSPHDNLRIDDAVYQLRENLLSADDFPPLNVVYHGGILWSLDNRRLWVFRKAGVAVIEVNLVPVNYSRRSAEFFENLEPSLERCYSSPTYYPRVRRHTWENAVENVAKCPPQSHVSDIRHCGPESPADILRPPRENSTRDRAQKTAAAAPKLAQDRANDIRKFNETQRRPSMDGSSTFNSEGTAGVSEPNTAFDAKRPPVRAPEDRTYDTEGRLPGGSHTDAILTIGIAVAAIGWGAFRLLSKLF